MTTTIHPSSTAAQNSSERVEPNRVGFAPVQFQFEDPVFQADPYPTYALLREHEPICYRRLGDFECQYLTRYRDIATVLRHPGFSAVRTPSEMMAPGVPEKFRRLGHLLTQMMLMKDGLDHTRLRGLVNKAFTPRVVEGLRPRIESIVEELLAAVIERGDGQMDVLDDLATPLPVIVIAELLGVPTEDRWRFKKWSDDIAVVLDGSVRAAGLPQAAESAAELADYLRDIVAKRRNNPREDLISGLAVARDENGVLSDDELIANCILLLLAGHETTTNLIGNGVLALLKHPDQMDRLRRDPCLAGGGYRGNPALRRSHPGDLPGALGASGSLRRAFRTGSRGDDLLRRGQSRPRAIP